MRYELQTFSFRVTRDSRLTEQWKITVFVMPLESPTVHCTPSLISLMVSVDVKHHVYLSTLMDPYFKNKSTGEADIHKQAG